MEGVGMRRVRTFVRRTGRGHLIKAVREQYLREDVGCGVRVCGRCAVLRGDGDDDDSDARMDVETDKKEKKKAEAAKRRRGRSAARLLVTDSTVLLFQLDLLKHAEFPALVVPQTALAQCTARQRDRVRAALLPPAPAAADPRATLLLNELMAATYVERRPGESLAARAGRAVLVAAAWLREHLQPLHVDVALLVDPSNAARRTAEAAALGLPTVSLQDVVTELAAAHPEVEDLLAVVPEAAAVDSADGDGGGGDGAAALFEEHVEDPDVLERGLRDGSMVRGILRVSMGNHTEGKVDVESLDESVVVSGASLNRAVDGDVVIVQMLPRDQWRAPSHRLLSDDAVTDAAGSGDVAVDDEADVGDAVGVPGAAAVVGAAPAHSAEVVSEPPRPTGKIVHVVNRKWRLYPGTLATTAAELGDCVGRQTLLFVPLDRRMPHIRIRTRQAARLVGKRILVALDSWSRRSPYPDGHYVQVLGEVGDKLAESEAILCQYDIPYEPFTHEVLACLPEMPWAIHDEDMAYRRDLRECELVCSIDPPGCTDIDDALSCRRLPNGHFRVGVHIADVSHFVRPDTAIDREAAERGNTMYLVEKRIDMLPGLLGENLCSLRAGVDRFAFSVMWELTADGDVVGAEFFKSAIRSSAAFSYGEAQDRHDDSSRADPLTTAIRDLMQLSRKLRARRMAAGALSLESMEVRFRRDEFGEDPSDVEVYQVKDTNRLVEEFMLLANVTVAEKIRQHYPQFAMLRRHPVPTEKNFEPLLEAAHVLGIELRVGSSRELSKSLDDAARSYRDPYFDKLIRIWTTRCMSTAVYFSSGTVPTSDYYHYGLAAPIYTHFTSPIRRYADVIVHRQLASALGLEPLHPSLERHAVQRLCSTLNRRHKNAQYAGRASAELHTVLFFRSRAAERQEAYVVKIKANGFAVVVPRYGFEGTVMVADAVLHTAAAAGSPFVFDLKRHQILRGGETLLSLFSKVVLEITVDTSNHVRPVLTLACVQPQLL